MSDKPVEHEINISLDAWGVVHAVLRIPSEKAEDGPTFIAGCVVQGRIQDLQKANPVSDDDMEHTVKVLAKKHKMKLTERQREACKSALSGIIQKGKIGHYPATGEAMLAFGLGE